MKGLKTKKGSNGANVLIYQRSFAAPRVTISGQSINHGHLKQTMKFIELIEVSLPHDLLL